MKSMTTLITTVTLAAAIPFTSMKAQPYIDLINIRNVASPDMGPTSRDQNATTLNYFNISATLPVRFNNGKDAIIASPFFERWHSEVGPVKDYSNYHYGLGLPIALLKSIPDSKWTVLTMVTIRMNDAKISTAGQYQIGGAVIGAFYRKNPHLTYKFGAYINGEFFGLFIIPLVGIDWQINERTNLFGILPASLTFERKLGNHFYGGAVLRTFTNSYHDAGPNYMRIDENQLGLYMDFYASKHLVLNLETGHSILRKIRGGTKYDIRENWNASDNFYFKVGLDYRIRLR
jgi:hypothetical protein